MDNEEINNSDIKTGGRRLKVVLVNNSDTLGGAAVVTYRLMNALINEGVDARMLVYTRTTDDPSKVGVMSTRYRRGLRFMWERGVIYLNNGMNRDNLFKVSIANTGMPLHRHPWVKEADVIALNWINQGLLSLGGIRKLSKMGKPIVWTMHDMWCMTGICHHAYKCERYKEECGCCRFLESSNPNDLSHKVWEKKKSVYDPEKFHFVAVSNWLARKARESSLLKDMPLSIIPNAFPIETFGTKPTIDISHMGITGKRKLILVGAARLDDPIKGIDYAIDALNYLFDNHPEVNRQAASIFFGDIRDKSLMDKLRFPHYYMGRINDPKLLRTLYSYGTIVMSSSLFETLPGTLIEGQAAGCLPVTFGEGGQSDIVEHKVNGYIAKYKDIHDLAEGIMWALKQDVDREALHESVGERFGSQQIAKRYIKLFNELLDKKQ